MLFNTGNALTFAASAILLALGINRIVCATHKDEKTQFQIYETELLKSFQKELEINFDLRSIECDDFEMKGYKQHTPVAILAADGIIGDFKTMYKYAQIPEVIRKDGVDVYSVESFYKFLSLMYAYNAVDLSVHGIPNKAAAIFTLDTVLRVNFTMGLTPAQSFLNVTKVELLNCTVAKQLIKPTEMFRNVTPHVTELFYEHFVRKEKPKVEDVIKDTFQAITNSSKFGSR